MTVTTAGRDTAPSAARPARAVSLAAVTVGLVVLIVVLGLIDITQGTAAVGPSQIWNALTGHAGEGDAAVVVASRLPRMFAGILVGVALGCAGAAMQLVSRNVLASPDTLAVNAGAYFSLTLVAVTGVSFPVLASSGVAFVGGLAAAIVVVTLSGLGSGTIRLVLAGSALAIGIGSITDALIILFPERTAGLYQWSAGSISQSSSDGVNQMAPVIVVGLIGLLVLARRMDALRLGDDAARSVGVNVATTRITTIVFAVLLSAVAVTIAGPIGFVGLSAPALVRPLARTFPGLMRARSFLPLSGLVGVVLVLGSDVLLRAVVGADRSVAIPTGVITTLVGAIFLIVMALRSRDSGEVAPADRQRVASRTRFVVTLLALVAAVIAVTVASMLLGDAKLLLGDVTNWLTGHAGRVVSFVLDTRVPRVLAALTAGAALALAGTLVQAVTRNPLAEPGILGVSGGAALGAVILVTTVPVVPTWGLAGAALVGGAVTAAIVFGLAARGGFRQNRLVLVGVGMSAATTAVITFLIALTDPFNATKALTWLSGSTYGRELSDIAPVVVVLAIGVIVAIMRHRQIDLISIDDDTPRLLGLRLGSSRLPLLVVSVLLTATAVSAVGVIGFVGLVAPHAARALVGRRHARVIPIAMLLGAFLVCLADVLGRTVIAPGQLGAGLLTAIVGTPYFIWLLWRSRR
ncbi:iron ABC transporter permease [Glaciihabitans sp. dw_435]|uniref:iron ABC transporter permease n=1 Tax=Glaciihabitans sp. dw_435 TaxID=2720081 RepID=UPI001BD4DD2F|nr:iron ABC transporter permease [Glaciihabitans sp. dw_435]